MPVRHNINSVFDQLKHIIEVEIPKTVRNTAYEFTVNNFANKGFGDKPWPETKKPVKKGKLMVRSGQLLGSVKGLVLSPSLVRISAGNEKVPYARIHNEGGTVTRRAMSETFVRNRAKAGKRKGQFRKGTSTGQGMSFKAYSVNMPQRQFMGASDELNRKIKENIGALFKKL